MGRSGPRSALSSKHHQHLGSSMKLKKPNLNLKELEADEINDADYEDLTVDEIKEKLPTFPSIKLADIVIANRYLGLYKELSVSAMEELGKRRVGGDTFEFEIYIDDEFKKLPKLDFSLPDLGSLINQLGNFKK